MQHTSYVEPRLDAVDRANNQSRSPKPGLGYLGICLSNPFAWGLAMFYCLFMVCRILRRETQTEA